ncbi:MAG: SET domain-containing protein [Pedosphaera sp.]|nr:SET domain-containing protein [Pedosphaera sp.]
MLNMNAMEVSSIVEMFEFKPSNIQGIGMFVRCDIVAGTFLIEYVGQRISKEESLRRCKTNNNYIFALDDEHDIDGNVGWNPARFINHSCQPNCDAELMNGRIWIVSRQEIKAGEEVTFNYGYDLESYREHPCRCGSPGCAGFIVAWELIDGLREHRRAEPQTQA